MSEDSQEKVLPPVQRQKVSLTDVFFASVISLFWISTPDLKPWWAGRLACFILGAGWASVLLTWERERRKQK